jgi:hypothetical protein
MEKQKVQKATGVEDLDLWCFTIEAFAFGSFTRL